MKTNKKIEIGEGHNESTADRPDEIDVRIGGELGLLLLRVAARIGAEEGVGQEARDLRLRQREAVPALAHQQRRRPRHPLADAQRQSHDAWQRLPNDPFTKKRSQHMVRLGSRDSVPAG